jgi:lysophospholipase L1-like esterase
MNFVNCALVLAMLICCAAASASVHPSQRPGMSVVVDAGDYTIRGGSVAVPNTVEVPVYGPHKVFVRAEEQVLSEGKPESYLGGTALKKTFGPVDTGTRLLYAICPGSVKVTSAGQAGTVYEEGKDYFLDRDWGGMSRIDSGAIPKGAKVYIDYSVSLERVDAVQVSRIGVVSVKQGKPAPICAVAPEPDRGCAVLATIYVPYRCRAITADNICPMPAENITWRHFIKVSGREHLSHTVGLLKGHKPLNVVCWGDSVTSGGSSSSHDRCYVELFRSALKSAYPKSEITLTNAGIGGSNTDSRRDGYEKEVLSYNPDLITVEFVNDVGLGPNRIKSNWAEFIARARQKNPNVEFILITPHQITPAWMGNFKASVDAMRQAAIDHGVAVADAASIWANLRTVGIPYETLLANGLNHPNDLGHEFFAESLMELLRPIK